MYILVFSLDFPLVDVHKQTGYSLIFNQIFTALGIIWWRGGEEGRTVPLHLTTASKNKPFFRKQCFRFKPDPDPDPDPAVYLNADPPALPSNKN
jgi:hypothetical protein